MAVPFGVAESGTALMQPWVLVAGLGVALMSSVIPYSLDLEALRRMPPRVFGILMSLEPAMAALIGLIVLQESLHWSQWIAVLCVVAASAGAARGTSPGSLTADGGSRPVRRLAPPGRPGARRGRGHRPGSSRMPPSSRSPGCSEVELVRRQVQRVARLAHHGPLVLVEVAVRAADDDADLQRRPVPRPASSSPWRSPAARWTLPKAKSVVSLSRFSLETAAEVVRRKFCNTSFVAMSWATRCRSEGSTVPSAAATSAHIATLASRNAPPLFRSFFFASNWVCICDADSLMRSHRLVSTPRHGRLMLRRHPGGNFYSRVKISLPQ